MLVAELLRCELCPAHLSQAIHAFPFPRFIGSNHSSKSLLELLSVCLLCGAENILRPSGKPSALQPTSPEEHEALKAAIRQEGGTRAVGPVCCYRKIRSKAAKQWQRRSRRYFLLANR